jgi:hypothetical protein
MVNGIRAFAALPANDRHVHADLAGEDMPGAAS